MHQARIRIFCLILGDFIGLSFILMLCAVVYQQFGGQYRLWDYLNLWPILPVFLFFAGMIRLYHGNLFYPGSPLNPIEELRRMFFAVTLTYVLLLAFLTLVRNNLDYSRVVLSTSWFFSSFLLIPLRALVRSLLKRFGIGQIPILIAGRGRTGITLAENFKKSAYYGFNPVGFLDDHPKADQLGTLDDAIKVGKKERIKIIFCCLPFSVIQKHLRDYQHYFSHIMIVVDAKWFPISWAYPLNINGLPGIELNNHLLQPIPRIIKRLFEGGVAAVGILCLWPLFLLLAVIVKCSSSGPVFYRAKRLGLGGKTIYVWKFRTMYADAEQKLKKLLDKNPDLAKQWQAKFKLDQDPRITPLGRFLRKSSLDELPQLFNVLRGEMAMIGPRPIVEEEIAYYGEKYEVFSRVKPGITGLWQISGRSEINYDSRVALNLYYICNWSIWLDLYILAMTFREVAKCRGAK